MAYAERGGSNPNARLSATDASGTRIGTGRAVEVFDGMESAGQPPNEFHFSSAISACAKCGQADVAMRLFDSMGRRGVTPNAVIPALASLYDVCTCQLPCRRFQSEA